MRCLVHFFALLLCLLPLPALAEHRVALVIGNDDYTNLPPQLQLKKAVNDANAIGDALQGVGFTVLKSVNATRPEMLRQLSAFRQSLHLGDVGFIYFSGHGIAVDGANWLLPSDIPGKGDAEIITGSAISESSLELVLTKAGVKTGVLIIDACRDNPFAATGNRSVGVTRGLARADDPPGGVFKLFSAGTGEKAIDRLSDDDPNPNSVFTRTLLPELTKPGQRLIDVAYAVKGKVADLAASIGEQQHPAQYDGGFAGLTYLAGEAPLPPSAPPASAALPVPDACAKAAENFDSAKVLGPIALGIFLSNYPNCPPFSGSANVLLGHPRPQLQQPPGKIAALQMAPKADATVPAAPGTSLALTGHGNTVVQLAFTPDGKIIASASYDESVRLWDGFSGREIRRFVPSEGSSSGYGPIVAFSADGRSVAIEAVLKTKNAIEIRDVATGNLTATLPGEKFNFDSVVFSPDGRLLAGGGYSQAANKDTIRVFDIAQQKRIRTIKGSGDRAERIAFLPDGQRLMADGPDNSIRILDATTGRQLFSIKVPQDGAGGGRPVALSPDGTLIASVASHTILRLWNAATGELVTEWKPDSKDVGDDVAALAVAPNNRILAYAGSLGGEIYLWNSQSHRVIATLKGHKEGVTSLAFSSDGTRLVSGGSDGSLRLWSLDGSVMAEQ